MKSTGLYNKYILPKVIDWTCNQQPIRKQREKIIPLASGNVLEIGIGSGFNLPFYNKEKVKTLLAIDPSVELWDKNRIDTSALSFQFNFVKAIAENIPADNNSFDTVVFTYILCSINDTTKTFEEIRRVLKSDGKIIFCEHGKAPDTSVQKWQNFISPIWKHLGGGCTLNKDIPAILKSHGLVIDKMDSMYIPGWKPASYNFLGIAKLR